MGYAEVGLVVCAEGFCGSVHDDPMCGGWEHRARSDLSIVATDETTAHRHCAQVWAW